MRSSAAQHRTQGDTAQHDTRQRRPKPGSKPHREQPNRTARPKTRHNTQQQPTAQHNTETNTPTNTAQHAAAHSTARRGTTAQHTKRKGSAPRQHQTAQGTTHAPGGGGSRRRKPPEKKKTKHRAAATKTRRHKGGGGKHHEAANGQAGNTKEARAHGEPRSGRPTKQTHSAKAQGTRGREPEKARDNGGAKGKKKAEHKAAARKTAAHERGGGGGAATTEEQLTAREKPQKRGERTASRGAGGQQNKQHTAPRPRAPGVRNQRKPKTTQGRNEKKNQAQRGSKKYSDTQQGGGGGRNHQGAADGKGRTTKETRAHREPESGRPTKQIAHSAKVQGTRGQKPKKAGDNGGARRIKKGKKTQGGGEEK